MKHEFYNGKYTVIFDEKTGKMEALRYGEPWQDLCGNKMVYCMLYEVDELKQQRAELLEALQEVMNLVKDGWIPDGETMFRINELIDEHSK